MDDTIHFTHDAASFTLNTEKDGVSVDDDGDVQIDWSDVERTHMNDAPWAEAFGTTEFFKLNGTVARPIKQRYRFGDTEMTLMKPREELKKAAWSAHNSPWTMSHPDTSMVKAVDDIKGFWRDPRYIDSMDNLDIDLYLPVDDSDAREYLERYGNVSIGFYNKITRVDAYDGVVGGEDDYDGIDGFQTDIYIDHIASVPVGRCSDGDNCGIHGHGTGVMNTDFIKDTNTTNNTEDNTGPDTSDESDDVSTVNDSTTKDTNMTDECTDCGGVQGDAEFISDMTIDAVADKNEEVQSLVDELDELREKQDSHSDEVAVKEEKIEELQEKVDEYESGRKEELVDEIVARTDALGTEEELLELDLDKLEDKHDLVMELATDEKTANGDSGSETQGIPTPQRATPWD